MADNFKYAQLQNFSLNGAGAIIGATTIVLKSMKDIDGNALTMSTDFGTIGFGTLEPGNGTQEEQISFTGLVNNANSTTTLTGVSNIGFTYPYTSTSGLFKTHPGSSVFIISNTSGFYANLDSKDDDATITGKYTFPAGSSANRPILSADDADATDNKQLITHGELVRTAIASAVAATTTQVGYSKLSTTSSTPTAPVVVETSDPRVPTQGENDALVGNNTDIAVGVGNKYVTQTGLQHNAEKYAVDTSGSSTAYVVTLSPIPISYTAGMIVYAKIVNANTSTTPTINVNSLGAKTIVKYVSTALANGDIAANMFCTFIYDGTNFVLQNPIANIQSILTNFATGSATGTANPAAGGGTDTITHSLGVIPRYIRLTTYAVGTNTNCMSVGTSTVTSIGSITNQQSNLLTGVGDTVGSVGLDTTHIAWVAGNSTNVTIILATVTSSVITLTIPSNGSLNINTFFKYVWEVIA